MKRSLLSWGIATSPSQTAQSCPSSQLAIKEDSSLVFWKLPLLSRWAVWIKKQSKAWCGIIERFKYLLMFGSNISWCSALQRITTATSAKPWPFPAMPISAVLLGEAGFPLHAVLTCWSPQLDIPVTLPIKPVSTHKEGSSFTTLRKEKSKRNRKR